MASNSSIRSSIATGSIDSITLTQDSQIRGPLIAGGVQGDVNYHEHFHSDAQRTNHDPEAVLASLKSMLRAVHRKLEIPKLPWLQDWHLPLEDYYVSPTLVCKEKKMESQLHLSELFGSGKANSWLSSRTLLLGAAGYGKTTLVRKLCYDYGKGESQYIQRFELVLLLNLVELEESLNDLIVKSLALQNHDSKDILEVVHKYQSSILIILDGLEELDDTRSNIIIPLLASKQLPQATVIVTARPGGFHRANSIHGRHSFDRTIELRGFQGKDAGHFLQLYLKYEGEEKILSIKLFLWSLFGIEFDETSSHRFKRRHKERLRRSLGVIHTQHPNRNLFECPLLLFLVIVVALETDMTSLMTRTDLYKAVFNFMIRRTLAKSSNADKHVDLFSFDKENPPFYIQSVNRFGEFALKALSEKRSTFTREEILANCENRDTIMQLLFTKIDSKSSVKVMSWFEPIHGSLMEFSAAYHLWYTLMSNSTGVHFLRSYNKMLHFFPGPTGIVESLVFPFLIGLCKDEELSILLTTLARVQKEYHWLKCYLHCQALVTESQLSRNALVTALLPFVPVTWKTSYFQEDKITQTDLLFETVLQGIVSGKIQCLEQDTEFPIDLRDRVIEGTLQFSDPTKAVLKNYESVKCHTLSFLLSVTKNTPVIEKLIKSINYSQISFSLTAKYLERYLVWLLLETIEGFLKDSLIHRLQCTCSSNDICEAIKKITALVHTEKIEILVVSFEGAVPLKEWEEFILCVNQSKQLVELNIFYAGEEKRYFPLCHGGEKTWRKLVLKGEIMLQDVHTFEPLEPSLNIQQLSLDGEAQMDDVENITNSNIIQCLKLSSSAQSGCFIECLNSSAAASQSLLELFIDFNFEVLMGKPRLGNLVHLHHLQVLGLACSSIDRSEMDLNLKTLNEIMVLLKDNPHFMRLELWMIREPSFVESLFESLSDYNVESKKRESVDETSNHRDVKLNTLLLFFEDESVALPILGNRAVKNLLLDQRLVQLFIGSYDTNFFGYFTFETPTNKGHSIQLFFPPSDGFVYELVEEGRQSENHSFWWEEDCKIIQIHLCE